MPNSRQPQRPHPASPISQQRVGQSARWQGNPTLRPPTDAELAVRALRTRGIKRLLMLVTSLIFGVFLYAPQWSINQLLSLPTAVQPVVLRVLPWLVRVYPWLQYAALLVLLALLLHLCVALMLVGVQRRNRAHATFRTLAIDVAAATPMTPLHGIDMFVGLQRLNRPQGRGYGREERFVFALVGGDDGRLQLRVRGPTQVGGRDWSSALRQLIEGRAPGSTARLSEDDLASAIQQAQPGQVLAWADLILQRDAAYPLNDLRQFVADPLGPLAAALRHGPHIHYAAYEIILRAVEDRWHQPIRTQLAQIQARLTPDDLPSHDALLTKAAHTAYDVVVRCLVIADDATTARAKLTDMRGELAQFDRTTRNVTQRLDLGAADRLAPGGAMGQLLSIPPLLGRQPVITQRDRVQILGGMLIGGALGLLLGSSLLASFWPSLSSAYSWLIPPDLPRPPFLTPGSRIAWPPMPAMLKILVCAGIGGWLGWFSCPQQQSRRIEQTLALLAAHTHRFAWPGPRWPLPLPGKRRSIMGPFDLAALWHIPDASLDTLVRYRGVRHLPKPSFVFLSAQDAQLAEQYTVLPPPRHPLELAQRRLALAVAERPDGTLGLIGPTVRDLRKGSECLGPMGSGKSCYIETLAVELARVGAGFSLIDAKGDLADQLLAALPPAVHERVIVIDLAATVVPCVNPMDARLLRTGVPIATVAGQIEQLFVRIDPETWQTSLGMQQFCRFGLYALLEGEPAPTLLLLDRFYGSTVYRNQVLSNVRDPQVRDFWRSEFPAMDDTLKRSIESFRRRLQRFITIPLVQQLFCQPSSTVYLPDLMDQRMILVIKLVPEVLSEELARVAATTMLASLLAATFTRQHREPDPELRWDWPLFIDEIQKFIDAEHPGDAEIFYTQTRSLGVGLHGAHQGLWQLGAGAQAAALQSLGGLAVLGPVKQDARLLAEAYAETGIQERDFAALQARQELLIRFPVGDQDSGLLSAIPRERPPATALTPTLRARLQAESQAAPFRAARAPAPDPQARADDAMLAALHHDAAARGAFVVAEEFAGALAAYPTEGILLLERLRTRCIAHQHAQAAALQADPRQLPDAALLLREQSALRYGVDPLLNACMVHLLAQRYPANSPSPRRRQRNTQVGDAPAPVTPPSPLAPPPDDEAWEGNPLPMVV